MSDGLIQLHEEVFGLRHVCEEPLRFTLVAQCGISVNSQRYYELLELNPIGLAGVQSLSLNSELGRALFGADLFSDLGLGMEVVEDAPVRRSRTGEFPAGTVLVVSVDNQRRATVVGVE